MKRLLLLALIPFIFSCDEGNEKKQTNEYLLNAELRYGQSSSEVLGILSTAGLSDMEDYLRYDISLYEIEYTSTYKGEAITCSGLLAYPETDDAVPIMSFQHGTMASHDEAPILSTSYALLSGIASAGYILIIPDMLGFGSSSQVLHPYYHKDYTAQPVIDMVRAAEEFAEEMDLNFNHELFLSGYSEGGYATMATHQTLETSPLDGIELIASAPASGGYDIKGVQEYFFSQETYHQPFFLAYVALAYQSVYDWDLEMSQIFNEPYASNIASYFDGSKSGSQINDLLTDEIDELLTVDFLNGLDTDPTYAELKSAFEDNSCDDWKPSIPTYLYHGSEDITVPYQNSVDTYEKMKANGIDTEIVTFNTIAGATHSSGVTPYIKSFVEAFDKLK